MPTCTHRRSSRRPAYTLLEVLLASAIGVLLMAGLYVAVDVQLRHAQIGRDIVEQSTLARGLLAKISNDVTSNQGPVDPGRSKATTQASTSGSQGATPATSGGNTTPTSGGSTQGTSSGSTSSASATSSSTSGTPATTTGTTSTATAVPTFNLGVKGDTGRLTLYVSRLPRIPSVSPGDAAGSASPPPVLSDQRRITYWLAGGSEAPLGLARFEDRAATADDPDAIDPADIPDEANHVIAEEVRSLTFRYFDGTTWQETWDGTAPGSDGMTPVGPPLAIEITLGLASSTGQPAEESTLKSYRHVVAILTANGIPQATTSSTTSP